MEIKLEKKFRSFEGTTEFYSHPSLTTQTQMKFSVYRPPQAATQKVPVLYWLSGLECSEENFMAKSGAQRWAAELGLMIVCPDTSPRGAGVIGESESWDLGLGASFYVNSTQEPWKKNYQMYDYITKELRTLVESQFPVRGELSGISGHSMGGHGALVIALKEPGRYRSVSAFSPIVAPTIAPWGQKAFSAYLGSKKADWSSYDAHLLVAKTDSRIPLLVDVGTDDRFLTTQLFPEMLERACETAKYPLTLRRRSGYDHSYYFVSTFIKEHLEHHASAMAKLGNVR